MADDSRIASILGDWIEQRDQGEEVPPEEVIAAHPEFADELRRRFRALSLMEDALSDETGSARLYPMRDGRYGDYKVAGEGGMGIVYWALDTDLNRQVAFKIVKPQGDGGGEAPSVPLELLPPGNDTPASKAFETLKARFLQEAWVTAGLEHPGIVPVYELGETAEGVPYYTMRFVRGSRTLASAIEDATDFDQRLALLEPFLKVCDTIRYAHAHGVIHRDLKPENVAIGEFGEVVVLDWGLAKLTGQEDAAAEVWQERLTEYREATDLRTVAGALGTPGYMSLEAALGEVEKVDERSDVYSLGAMLYQLLTGRLPHTFTSYGQMVGVMLEETPVPAHEVDPQIPADLSMICASALAREKAARFASAGDLAGALRRWQRESAVEREVRELLAKAEAAFEGTEGLEGQALLKQVDRVTTACSRVTDKSAEHPRATELAEACEEIRGRAIAERENAARRRILVRVAAIAVLLLLVASAGVAWLLDAKRRRAEAAEARTAAALRSARAFGLANAAARVGATDPMLALLLAREAARIESKPPVVEQLRAALRVSHERACTPGGRGWVVCAGFSPGGDRFVTGHADGTATVWDAAGKELRLLQGAGPPVATVAFLGAGERVLTVDEKGVSRIWTLEDGQFTQLEGSASPSPDGSLVVTWGAGRRAAIRHPDGSVKVELPKQAAAVTYARFTARGDKIITKAGELVIRVWDLEGQELAVVSGPAGGAESPILSPAGDRLLGVLKGAFRLWDLEGAELTRFPRLGPTMEHAGFTPDGKHILAPAPSGEVLIWNLKGEETGRLTGAGEMVSAFALSVAGDRILAASMDGVARLYDLRGEEIARFVGHAGPILTASFSREGDRVVTGSFDGTARVWSVWAGGSTVLRGHRGGVSVGVFHPAGDRLLTGGLDGAVRTWGVDGRELQSFKAVQRGVASLAISPAGDRILVSDMKPPKLYDMEGRILATFQGHRHNVPSAVFSPDGKYVLTASIDRSARVWDLEGKLVTRIDTGDQIVHAEFSHSGDRILTVTGALSRGRTLRIWSRGGEPISSIEVEDREMRMLLSGRFSPDSTRVLASTGSFMDQRDNLVWIYAPDGKELERYGPFEAPVTSASFSPDGRLLLVGLQNGSARITATLDRKALALLSGHAAEITSAEFSPVGDQVLTTSADGTARLWPLGIEALLDLAERRSTRDLTTEERERFSGLLSD